MEQSIPKTCPMKTAVLLNTNAKRVTEKLIARVRASLPEGCELFCTSSFDEAKQAAERIVCEGFTTVFTGGGDGTFVGTLNEIMRVAEERQSAGSPVSLPRFGILKLGTGNALASLCGAKGGKGIFEDIRSAHAGECPASHAMRLVQTDDGIRVPFAGVGLDAGILNYYISVKGAFAGGPFKRLFEGALGYFSAVVFKAVPYYLFQGHTTDVEVIARAPAWKFGDGDVLSQEPVPEGTTLYKGSVLLTSVGTSPYYGYRFTMFPLWNVNRDLMHLRIVTISSAELVAHLPSVWRGTYRSPKVHEYLCSDVEVRALGDSIPYQLGGDAGGYRKSVRWTVSKETFQLVDFTPQARALSAPSAVP